MILMEFTVDTVSVRYSQKNGKTVVELKYNLYICSKNCISRISEDEV